MHAGRQALAQALSQSLSLSLTLSQRLSLNLSLSHTHTLILCGLLVVCCRSMQWVWNSTFPAWTTHVSISGIFVLIREEQVNGVVVSPLLLVRLNNTNQTGSLCALRAALACHLWQHCGGQHTMQ